jgi:hypothetical protein
MGMSISTNTDSITSGSEKVHSGHNLYFKLSCKYRPVPLPVFELQWLETKVYPQMFIWSEVRSLSQVSDTPITHTGNDFCRLAIDQGQGNYETNCLLQVDQ